MQLRMVTVPIGNLEDITTRAKDSLNEAKLIFAEDTRSTKKLLELLGIGFNDKRIFSFHDHSRDQIEKYVEMIKEQGALVVSDAGSPIISDPAFPLVKACVENGIELETNPGVSAVTTALELSALPAHPFTFHGFLPRSDKQIQDYFSKTKSIGGTHLFFESPHRMESTLKSLKKNFPEAQVAVCRELTKKFESVYRFQAKDLDSVDITYKGEFVLVVYFKEESSSNISDKKLIELSEKYLQKKTPKNLAKLLSVILGESVNDVYQRITE